MVWKIQEHWTLSLPAISFSKVPNGSYRTVKENFIISCGFNTNPHDKIAQIVCKNPF